MNRNVLAERAQIAGITRNDTEVAVTIMVLQDQLKEDAGVLSPRWKVANAGPTCAERQAQAKPALRRNEHRARAYQIVRDVVARRDDGRAAHAEPLDAFADTLSKLGDPAFRMWWTQTVGELRRTDPATSPMSATVLSAALVEAALTFTVRHARATGTGAFPSRTFDDGPRTWGLDDLTSGAAAGSANAILDGTARNRAVELARLRQRIHVGRLLEESVGRVPDLRPEEARAARETAELVVRRIMDWLERHPTPA